MAQSAGQTEQRDIYVIFVPGIIMPVMLSYAPLMDVLQNEITAYPKELEVYNNDAPPVDYKLDMEIEGIKRIADDAGLETFHLVAYSGGGASSLAFASVYPERLSSLALIEPAWIGNEGLGAEDTADWAEIDEMLSLPPEKRMKAFQRWQMKKGVEPPELPVPKGPPPEWMLKRPAGIEAIVKAFKTYKLEREKFRNFNKPVYYALGGLSRGIYERMANKLKNVFPVIQVEIYENCSHLDPPHRKEPKRFAEALRKLWKQ
jgi:pimeloyl-ACP methyl ester carboxylesterase